MAATILRSALVAHGFGTSDTPVAIVVVPSGADAFNLNADAYLRRASLRLGASGDALKPVWHRLPPTSLKQPKPATEGETQETQEPANAAATQRPTAEERSMKAAEDREAAARRRTEAMSGRGFESAYRAHFKENAENEAGRHRRADPKRRGGPLRARCAARRPRRRDRKRLASHRRRPGGVCHRTRAPRHHRGRRDAHLHEHGCQRSRRRVGAGHQVHQPPRRGAAVPATAAATAAAAAAGAAAARGAAATAASARRAAAGTATASAAGTAD
jgi:hypothetical protein